VKSLSLVACCTVLGLASPTHAEHLYPRNECDGLEGVDRFQMRLVTAVANRNAAMLEPLVHPQVHLDFGGGSGWELMRERLTSPQLQLWSELDDVLRLGCATTRDGRISMPYYFLQEFPEGFDAYGTYISLGSRVPLYRSETGGRIVRYLNWEAVENVAFFETVENLESAKRWQVRAVDGTLGFVTPESIRALADYRLSAEMSEGRWRIMTFIAGD